MKKYLLVVGVLTITIMSCKKEKTANHSTANVPLQGSWELRVRLFPQVPNVSPYYLPGNGEKWSFTDSTYQYFVSNQLHDHGSYSITQDISPETGMLMNKFIFDSDSTRGLFYQISYDTLIIYRGFIGADGFIEKFLKQQSN